MKTTIFTTFAYLLILSVMVGGLLLTPMTAASTISANVIIDPEKINLSDSPDSWNSPLVLAQISFPKKSDRLKVRDINVSTVLLDGVIPALKGEAASATIFKAWFDRATVVNYLWLKLYHMGYAAPFKNVEVELTVTGNLNDGTPFAGSDTILVSAK